MKYSKTIILLIIVSLSISAFSQNYFYGDYTPFNKAIPTPEEFLGYKIGEQHTQHSQVISYYKTLAKLSERATLIEYGQTHEGQKLILLRISSMQNSINIDLIKKKHLDLVNPFNENIDHKDLPLIINLGYNVHGNEPSGTEAALLTAYTLTASRNIEIFKYLRNSVIFIDPCLNPDGRDRHTQWVNANKSKNLVADYLDIEHQEAWPTGRTNHYWFDLNRDWLLAVHPESQAKLKWFHDWYPNIVTDFHEMRTSTNTFFFEPEKVSGSEVPMATEENAELNKIFAKEFAKSIENLGSLYFTGELYDATYPGYGSTYGDLQGALALLFEQTTTRGHLKEMEIGNLTFSYAIKNQYTASLTTINTAVNNKDKINDYQQNFFKKVKQEAGKDPIKAYLFSENDDYNRTKEFIKLLKQHHIKVYKSTHNIHENGKDFLKDKTFIVPTYQYQYKMVQSIFETHKTYRDSVFYDASAWSVANFYNIAYSPTKKKLSIRKKVTMDDFNRTINFEIADYAYIIPWTDYYAPSFLYALQKAGIKIKALTKKLTLTKKGEKKVFSQGSLVIPISLQSISKDSIYNVVLKNAIKHSIFVTPILSGTNKTGINLGSRSLITLQKPKVLLWVGDGVSPYEAGEVWHLTDTRLEMPISKINLNNFNKVDLNKYNTMVMVSGKYNQLNTVKKEKIKNWVAQGNSLITTRNASSWVIKNKLVKEKLLFSNKDTASSKRLNYADASQNYGKTKIGGAILKVDLDITHPIGYGYTKKYLPIYKNNSVWLKPSKSPYSTVAKYSENSHIDGYISDDNYKKISKSASIIVSSVGKGRVILFADNPNFRGAWYGTNKLFLNALFFGNHISVPK